MFKLNKEWKEEYFLIEVKVKDVLKSEKNNNNVNVKDLKNGIYNYYCDTTKIIFKTDKYYYDGQYLIINNNCYLIKYVNEKFNVNKRLGFLKLKNNNNLKYLYYLLSIKKENKKFYNGVGLQNFKKVLFLDSKIKIHKNIEEQNKIRDFLESNLESNLENIEKLIDKVNNL